MLQVCYCPEYIAPTHTNSMEKMQPIAQRLTDLNLACLIAPEPIDPRYLYQLHQPDFVDAFMNGMPPLANSSGFSWTPRLRQAILHIHGGQILAAKLALQQGISANLAQGFHHAVYERGLAYCTFNGLALIAQAYPKHRIFVLDCDQHAGNGTAEFTLRTTNLFNYTIFGYRFGYQDTPRSLGIQISTTNDPAQAEAYLNALEQAFIHIQQWKTDLIVYQAGMDVHQDDPHGSAWCDRAFLYERDLKVFEFAQRAQIPLVFVLAGGYQPLDVLTELHLDTFRAAAKIYG